MIPDVDRDNLIVQFYCIDGLTLQEVGDKFGLSRERVRQILVRKGIEGRRFGATKNIKVPSLTPQQKILRQRARFWSNLNITANPNECWEWKRPMTSLESYPRAFVNNKADYIHRISYTLTYGTPKHFVLHRCNNPRCANPSHLYDGTAKDNAVDRVNRFKTEQQCRKLSTDEIILIKVKLSQKIPRQTIAEFFQVNVMTIYKIERGFSYTSPKRPSSRSARMNSDYFQQIHQLIRQRLSLCISQVQLSILMGISNSAVSRYEGGERYMNENIMQRYTKILEDKHGSISKY